MATEWTGEGGGKYWEIKDRTAAKTMAETWEVKKETDMDKETFEV